VVDAVALASASNRSSDKLSTPFDTPASPDEGPPFRRVRELPG
jgi:hypothetical protein